ncbi:hypothetical protein [Cryobacterium zhongshanensis]|uniref:Uncharacterized protein n=1 Tax=Cryobacterium zhongshanensis TaxID=2928153 RepID=A0AA41R2L1_9MICO|nr:hypothetical protein [Cryobacterium zhongshanensis]MCI4659701.1 hypothetical protein [Cryobacterium zhongshanensis]
MKTLTEDEFDTQFTTVPDATGEDIRPSDHGLDRVSTKLWTIVNGDDGSLVIASGWHYVNRIGYVITEEDWTEPTEAIWMAASEDEEEDEDADEG